MLTIGLAQIWREFVVRIFQVGKFELGEGGGLTSQISFSFGLSFWRPS
jgi:hypothetical protein